MDAGEYDTNTLLINNISSITFRLYEPVAPQSQSYTSTVACNIERSLRRGGHLAYADVNRRAIWCFYLPGKDGLQQTTGSPAAAASLDVCGFTLAIVEEGAFEPISLLKNRGPGQNPLNTPNSSLSSGGSALERNAQGLSVHPAYGAGNSATEPDSKIVSPLVPEGKGHAAGLVKDVHEYFISAVLSILLTKLCSSSDAIPLNSRTALLPMRRKDPSSRGKDSELFPACLVTFRVYLTTTGSLLVSLTHSPSGSLCLLRDNASADLVSPGTGLLAAPFGTLCTFQGTGDAKPGTTPGLEQSPCGAQVTHIPSGRQDRWSPWKSLCAHVLEARGVSAALWESCSWTRLQFIRSKGNDHRQDGKRTPIATMASPLVSWPSVLCFRRCRAHTTLPYLFNRDTRSQYESTFDPLTDARSWFKDTPNRDGLLANRKKEREAISIHEPIEVGGGQNYSNDYSPLALRHVGHNGAVSSAPGTMYPTPPDGVQNVVGATPTFDGTTSSPSNQVGNATIVDGDATMTELPGLVEGFTEPWGADASKRERRAGSLLGDSENLFADIGTDMFGDEVDITDADFNFFDEAPGDVMMDTSPTLGDPPGSSVTVNANRNIEAFGANNVEAMDVKMKDLAVPPIFTKPELRHARSTLTESSRQKSGPAKPSQQAAVGAKRQSSPFNQDTVYKRIRASMDASVGGGKEAGRSSHATIFDKVEFGPSLLQVNKKYEDSGQYDFYNQDQNSKDDFQIEYPPTTGYLLRHGKVRNKLKELPTNMGLLMAKITGGAENGMSHQSPTKATDLSSDADDMSLVSDQDDSSDATDEPPSPTNPSIRRKRQDDDGDSLALSFKGSDIVEEFPSLPSLDISQAPRPDAAEVVITKYFEDPEPPPTQLALSDHDFITVAQILTDQAVSGALKFQSCNRSILGRAEIDGRRAIADLTRRSIRTLQAAMPPALSCATTCRFRPFIEVQDVPMIGQPTSRMQPRPVPGAEQLRPNLYQIQAPHLELRRYDKTLSVLPSAVRFWESLGLGPSQGLKQVQAVCVFPDLPGVSDNASAFLDRIRDVYASLKLGSFERLPATVLVEDALVPCEVGIASSPEPTTPRLGSVIGDQITRLSQALASLTVTEKNFVVYFIYRTDDLSSIAESCAAFNQLFETYKRALADRKAGVSNELVLQLIPVDLVASSEGLIIPSPTEYARLCLETYDRCTTFGGPMPCPAIVLEQPPPRGIDFKLTTTPSSSLMYENSCIHIAYAQSVDERWVTAAWTDNRGAQQLTASYCRGRKGRTLSTPLADVAHEIWETTHDLISARRVQWRIIITKCGPMEQSEIDFWVALGQTESKASVSLMLMTVDTTPSLQLIPPPAKIPTAASSVFYTTPVSTPQPSIVSPDQGGNAVTPVTQSAGGSVTTPGGPGENSALDSDPDATLTDVTDTTWGVILSHRLNNSISLVDLHPALISGYLVKRGGGRLEDPPSLMEVNIVHSEGNPRAYEALLREMLGYFRALGTLCRARGVTEPADVRPWHIAAAEKGVRALYQIM